MSYGYQYRNYLELFDEFLAKIRARERERYGNELLADEWNKRKQKSGFMIAHTLENWTAMDWFANRSINLRIYGGKEDLPRRIRDFIRGDPTHTSLIKRKVTGWASYSAELKLLGGVSQPL